MQNSRKAGLPSTPTTQNSRHRLLVSEEKSCQLRMVAHNVGMRFVVEGKFKAASQLPKQPANYFI
jgi:hypothetical protein